MKINTAVSVVVSRPAFSMADVTVPDTVGGGEYPASSDIRAPTVDLLVLLQSDLPLDLRLHSEQP